MCSPVSRRSRSRLQTVSATMHFAYLNLRMGRGRSAEVKKRAGEQLLADTRAAHFEPLFAERYHRV